MIELKNISKTFGWNSNATVPALQDVSLKLDNGSFTVVVGANGSGKSTLLNILAGTVKADTGAVLIDEKDITRSPDYRRSKWVARIFQNPLMGTAPDLSILENFRLASLRSEPKKLRIGTGAGFRNRVKDKIAILNLGLENKLDQPIGELSGGQRQALTLLMATMDESKILLMDEPTAALDPKMAAVILNLANDIIRESRMTALLVTHHLKDARTYGDRIIRMHEGKIANDLNRESKAKLGLPDLFRWFE